MQSTWHWVTCRECKKRYARSIHYGGSKHIAEKACKMCSWSCCYECWIKDVNEHNEIKGGG